MIILLLLLVLGILFLLYRPNIKGNPLKARSVYRGQPTKSFDSERELPPDFKYLGGPTKCFDCERQYINMYGPRYADLAQPTKCFDCERQYL